MKTKFPKVSRVDQTIHINELLGADEAYFSLYDIFKYLPKSLIINGHRGDRFISDMEISYQNVNPNMQVNLIKVYPIPINGDIYDAFINVLIDLDKYGDQYE